MAGPLAGPGAARSRLRAPRWPACFARLVITRRLPFAFGAAVKVPPPSLAPCPGRPDGASSPVPRSLANLLDPGAAERHHGPPGAPGPLRAPRLLRASASYGPPLGTRLRPPASRGLSRHPRLCDGRGNTALQRSVCRTAHTGPSKHKTAPLIYLPRPRVYQTHQYTICPVDRAQRINCEPDKVPPVWHLAE